MHGRPQHAELGGRVLQHGVDRPERQGEDDEHPALRSVPRDVLRHARGRSEDGAQPVQDGRQVPAVDPGLTRRGAPQTGQWAIQVGAYSTRAQAEAGWSQLAGRYDALQGRSPRVLQGTADSGTIFRLQAVAGSAAEADTLCRSIKAAGGDCQVKR